MSIRESVTDALKRWERLELLQSAYPEFVPFLHDGMEVLGFSASEIQEDIALWMQHGPDMLMVQAQRGQAKTTIAALFAVWSLIHEPKLRVLVVSAGETQANEISTLIVRLITQWDILEMMKPDSSNGDRTSVEHFDVHYSLKGIDKSPSVACVGINSNLPGKRADLLIADDVESPKNGMTAPQRQVLEHLTKEFSSISSSRIVEGKKIGGRVLWLGTPQTVDSIYNALPGRGVSVRIWPGRYPNAEQVQHYGEMLAPLVKRKLTNGAETTGYGLDGKQGAPTDPLLKDEEELLKKEADQGPSQFQLQFMLLTQMTDAMRHPLKVERIVVMPMPSEYHPMAVIPGFGQSEKFTVNGQTYKVTVPHEVSQETGKLQSTCLYLDPAGGGVNGDETAYAFGGPLNSSIRVVDWGGVPGGHSESDLKAIADLVIRLRPTIVKVEKNFGFGLYMTAVRPVITAAIDKYNKELSTNGGVFIPTPGFEEDMVHGQKELRIIDTLEPVIGRGALVMNREILEREGQSVARYEPRLRNTYSGLFQLAKITRDKQSLIHEDRIDALAGLVNHYGPTIAVDQQKAIKASQQREYDRLMSNPLSKPLSALSAQRPQNSLQKRIRKL